MKTFAIAALSGVALTGVTVLIVAALRGHEEPSPVAAYSRPDPITLAPPPREPQRTLISSFAPRSSTPTEALEPAPVFEPAEVSALADVHEGASLVRALPGLDSRALRQAMTGSATGLVDQPARPVSRPTPTYPAAARRNRTEGFVRVRLRVDRQGRVTDVVVVEAEPAGVFDQVALDAARRYRFEPATRGGYAVASTLEQRIVFRLQQ